MSNLGFILRFLAVLACPPLVTHFVISPFFEHPKNQQKALEAAIVVPMSGAIGYFGARWIINGRFFPKGGRRS